MNKSKIKNYILSTVYFLLLILLKIISALYSQKVSAEPTFKYYVIFILLACVIFIILGIIIGILSNREKLSKTEKILDLILIALPAILLMMTGFMFIKVQDFIPEFFKGNNIVFIIGGAVMIGSLIETAIKGRKQK